MNDLINIAMNMCVIAKPHMRNAFILERAEFENYHIIAPFSKPGYNCYYPAVICVYDRPSRGVTYFQDNFDECDSSNSYEDYVTVWEIEKHTDWDSSKPNDRLHISYVDMFNFKVKGRPGFEWCLLDTGVYIAFRKAYSAKKKVIKTVPVAPNVGLVWKDSSDHHYAIVDELPNNSHLILSNNPYFTPTNDVTATDGYPTTRVTEYHWIKL